MVSKRQRLARNRCKEANPELFPAVEPTPPKDPSKKKKQKSVFKRKKSGESNSLKPRKFSAKKHPLRVAGMKPGESCYICKGLDHIAKNCPKKSEWERNKTCLSCRQRGHSLKNCPDKTETMEKKLCYNCGETGHSLSTCPLPLQDGGTRYANCFICDQVGHLSKDCPKNKRGIYPKGGCCKICSGVTHLAKDCPNKNNRASGNAAIVSQSFESGNRPNQITRFSSGDDLEDDFTPAVPLNAKDAYSKETGSKRTQGARVVNFIG